MSVDGEAVRLRTETEEDEPGWEVDPEDERGWPFSPRWGGS